MPSDEMVEKARKVVAAIEDANDRSHGAAAAWCPDEAVELIAAALAAAEAGEPAAWRYELAGAVTHNPDGSKTGVNWKTHINTSPPCVPDWGVRNLTPLFASPPSEASKGACPVCGCEEINSRGLWTCECPAPSEASREAIRKEAFEEAAKVVRMHAHHALWGAKVGYGWSAETEAAIATVIDIVATAILEK